jgi:hypothetical protein
LAVLIAFRPVVRIKKEKKKAERERNREKKGQGPTIPFKGTSQIT